VAADLSGAPDIKDIESSLQKLWERARRLSEVILQLRKENEQLRSTLAEHQDSEHSLSASMRRKEQELAGVQAELKKLQQNGSSFLNREEKEALTAKIKELISKIDARL
jgi:chromosome segregation ATPase